MGAAEAFALHSGICDGNTDVAYRFVNGTKAWTTTLEDRFSSGADNRDVIDEHDGNHITDVWEVQSGGIEIFLNAGTAYGETICDQLGNLDSIDLGSDGASKNDFEAISHHEMGHAHGFAHSAADDSHDGEHPTMVSACSLSYAVAGNGNQGHEFASRLRSREQDDGGNILSVFDLDLHANASFEDSGSWTNDVWGLGGGATTLDHKSGGAPVGAQSAEFGPGGYLYQTMRVTDPADMIGRFWFKKDGARTSGTIQLTLYGRKISYPSNGNCSDFTNGWDMDSPSFPNGSSYILYKAVTATPTTSWNANFTSHWTGVDPWNGVDVRVRVNNNMTIDGGDATVHVDHVRAEHQ